MQIQINLTVTDQFLRDVLCTACEGGSNYWAHFKSLETFAGQFGKEWQKVRVTEYEDGEKKHAQHVIGLEEMREGVRRMIARDFTKTESHAIPYSKSAGEVLIAVVEDDAGNIDADLADLILQCACLGHIVYG